MTETHSHPETAPLSEPSGPVTDRPVLTVQNLSKHYGGRSRWGRSTAAVQAVNDVSLTLSAGRTLAVVGESGCGKSSLANAVLQLDPPSAGSVRFGDRELVGLSWKQMQPIRRQLQVIFQDPYASLNNRRRIRDIVDEPLRIHYPRMSAAERSRKVSELMELVGLGGIDLESWPTRLSGGQRQRLGIARAVILEPSVIVCDEAVSALDVSVQAQVLNLLRDLQRRLGLAYLFITHDLAVVRQVADDVAVMYLGRIVESGPADQVLDVPQHPYTRALLDAVPGQSLQRAARVEGDIPNPQDIPAGCPFHPRCPRRDADRCLTERPDLVTIGERGQQVACHHPLAPAPVAVTV